MNSDADCFQCSFLRRQGIYVLRGLPISCIGLAIEDCLFIISVKFSIPTFPFLSIFFRLSNSNRQTIDRLSK